MAIQSSLGCTMEEAEKIANAYWSSFKGIAKFKTEGAKAVKKNGYVLMCKYTGHKMFWWDHKKWLEVQTEFNEEGFWDDYRQNHKGTGDSVAMKVKEHFKAGSKWERMALNSVTQGTGAVILKNAVTKIFNYVVDNNLFNKVKFCALVHDEVNIEYPKELNFSSIIKEKMEESAAEFCKSMPIPAEASVSNHWVH